MALSHIEILWRAVEAAGKASYQANITANAAEKRRTELAMEKARLLGRQNFVKEAKKGPKASNR